MAQRKIRQVKIFYDVFNPDNAHMENHEVFITRTWQDASGRTAKRTHRYTGKNAVQRAQMLVQAQINKNPMAVQAQMQETYAFVTYATQTR